MSQACIDLPDFPDLPSFSVTPPQLANVSAFSGDFCCHFELRPPFVNDVIDALNAEVAVACAGLSAGIMVATIGISEVVSELRAKYNEIRNQAPSCPLDGGGIVL